MSWRRLFVTAPLVVVGVAVVVAVAVWYARPKKLTVIIDTSGTRGLAVKGTAQVDGTSRELTGAVPAQFVLEGSRVVFSLSTPDDAGELRVKASLGDIAFGSKGSGRPPKYAVRGWAESGWGWSPPTSWIEGFDPNGDPGWMVPPP